jgi:CRP-like cAMP-binding protein
VLSHNRSVQGALLRSGFVASKGAFMHTRTGARMKAHAEVEDTLGAGSQLRDVPELSSALGKRLASWSDPVMRGCYGPGRVLFTQGSRATSLFWIESGLVKVLHRHVDGEDVVVWIRGKGFLLGTPAAVLKKPHDVTAITITDCTVIEWDSGSFIDRVRLDSSVLSALLTLHSLLLYEQVERLVILARLPARRRLELLLRDLAALSGVVLPGGAVRLSVPLAQHELAGAANVTPETLSRLMAALERDGLIVRRHHHVSILNSRLLDQLASAT